MTEFAALLIDILRAAVEVTLELAPWLLLGAAIAGLLHVVLPGGFVQRQLSGKRGVVKAVLLGIPLPLCSCSVIPTGIGLRRDGASRGATIGFLIATPQTGVDSILVAAGMLGWPFALAKVLAALVMGVLGGWLTDRLPAAEETLGPTEHASDRRTWRAGLEHAIDLIRVIWRWLVFGVLLSAVLTVALPTSSLQSLAGEGLIAGFVLALLVSLPLYVCATASVPIAAALIHAGLPTGAAMVFLMAGPATNVATMGAVRRAFGSAVTGVYLAVMVAGSIGFGIVYETFFESAGVTAGHIHDHKQWWTVLAAYLLGALLLWFAAEDLRSLLRRAPSTSAVHISVEGMTCAGCASRLERALNATPGVENATVSIDTKLATVDATVDEEQLSAVIRKAGFEPVGVDAIS